MSCSAIGWLLGGAPTHLVWVIVAFPIGVVTAVYTTMVLQLLQQSSEPEAFWYSTRPLIDQAHRIVDTARRARVAITDISEVMRTIGAATDYRLIGGVAVLLHIQRLGLDLPLRATGDADIGVQHRESRY